MPALHKTAISRKTNPLVLLAIFLYSMDLWHYPTNYSKRFIKKGSIQVLICSLLQAKHLVITQEKEDWVNMVLCYLLQQNVSVELHVNLNVEAISFAIG